MANKNNLDPFGVDKRIQGRKKHTEKVKKTAEKILKQQIPELFFNEVCIKTDHYDRVIAKVISLYRQAFDRLSDLKVARNYLARFINMGNKQQRWLLPVPAYMIRIKREQPLRTMTWFKKVNLLSMWLAAWEQQSKADADADVEIDQEKLLGLILLSASLHGGLCIPQALVSLAQQVTANNALFFQYEAWFWIDLTFKSSNQAVNYQIKGKNGDKGDKGDNEDITLRRWYPDGITLALIHQYLCKHDSTITKLQTDDAKTSLTYCWALIKNQLRAYYPSAAKGIGSFSLYCKCAIGVTEQKSGIHLSQANVQYAIGHVPSASLAPNFQSLLFKKPIVEHSPKSHQYGQFFSLSTPKKQSTPRNKEKSLNYEKLLPQIRAAIKKNMSKTQKNTTVNAKNQLELILSQPLTLAANIIIQWLLFLLVETNLKVTSVSTYFSSIGKMWLNFTLNVELKSLDESDFFSLYEEMLDVEVSEKKQSYSAARLQELHQYASRYFDFPPLSQALPYSKKGRSYVRTGFISESVFEELINHIEQLTDLQEITRQGLICLLIIAFRAGLRRGELLKLRLIDVEKSSTYWVYIKNNKFGNNKSRSALRKIPLSVLLLPQELAILKRYIAIRQNIIQNETNALLFSMPLTHCEPHDGNKLSQMVKFFLAKSTGETSFVFHHLRHTALSKLHIVLENNHSLIQQITPYSSEQAQKIRRSLVNVEDTNQQNLYWALSSVAGHITPETTFAHYLHFTDKIMADKLSQHSQCYTFEQVHHLSHLTKTTISRLCNSDKINKTSINFEQLKPLLIKRLKPYTRILTTKQIKVKKLKKAVISPLTVAPTFELCLAVLYAAEQGATLPELILEFQLSPELIQTWLTNAEKLAQLTTSKGKSKLFSRYKPVTENKKRLCPSKPQSNIEQKDAMNILTNLKGVYKTKPKNIIFCIAYFLQHCTYNARLTFSKPTDLKKFLKIMSHKAAKVLPIIPLSRWNVYLYVNNRLSDEKSLNKWQLDNTEANIIFIHNQIKGKENYPVGKVELSLSHPTEKELLKKVKRTKNYKAFNSNALKYIFHVLAIMLIKKDS